jgi:glycosyltransferase involved in cell wall biosynthesis
MPGAGALAMTDRRPLTIALLLESDGPGGAEVVVFQLAEELRRRGHVVVPVGPANGFGWLSGKFRASGFEPATFTLRSPLDWGCVRGLREVFRRRGVDVAHTHEFTMAVYGAMAAKLEGLRHVTTMHGNQGMTRVLRRRVALRWAFRNSGAAVAVSRATKRQLDADLGLRPGVLAVVHNGIPVRTGDPEPVRRELGVQPGEVLILAVGNLDPRKGHIVLLRALARLESAGVSVRWRLAIVGGRGGPEREALESFAAGHGFADRMHILLNRDDVPSLLSAADVFCMPSLWEGLPLAVLEAMFASTAIVASATSGIPEAITSEREGLLVPPGDDAALAAALRRALESPAERARLAGAALRRAENDFTIGSMADAYERLYYGDGDE